MPGWDFRTTRVHPGTCIGLGESVNRGNTLQRRPVDRVFAVAFTLLIALALPASALAADSSASPDPSASASPSPLPAESPSPSPSSGELVLDGVLGVIVLASDDGPPIPGATVTVQASSGTGAAFAFQRRTDSDGKVTFTGLPRPTDPEVTLLWVVSVRARLTVVDGDCKRTTNYVGSTEVQAREGARSLPVFAQAATSIEICGAEPGSGPSAGNGGGTGGGHAVRTNRPATGGGGIGGAASARPALTPPATTTESAPASHQESPVAALALFLFAAWTALFVAVARRRGPALTDPH